MMYDDRLVIPSGIRDKGLDVPPTTPFESIAADVRPSR